MEKARRGSKTAKSGVTFSKFKIPVEDHAEFKAAVLAGAQKRVDEGKLALDELLSLCQRCDPLQILATCASYGLQAVVDKTDGVIGGLEGTSLEQFHVELLQAVVLIVPSDKWGLLPATPSDVQMAFDRIRNLAEAFFASRLLAHEEIEDPQEREAADLQERIRLHTQTVRNWAYFSDVVSISKELYSQLDINLAEECGFSATQLIDVGVFLGNEWERRLDARFQTLRRIARNKSARQVIRAYYKEVPELQGSPAELLAVLPKGVDGKQAFGYILGHFDLRLRDVAVFTISEVSEGAGIPQVQAELVLNFLSLAPGALADNTFEHIYLDNPVSVAPAVAIDGDFFVAMPQLIFTNIHSVMRRLCDSAKQCRALEKTRSKFLEKKVEGILRGRFPSAKILPNLRWTKDKIQYETDLLVLVDQVALVVEVKSHQLTPPGLRGAAKRLRRHVDDILIDPSLQSLRLKETLDTARAGDPVSRLLCEQLNIPYEKIRRTLRMSVSLEDFSVLSASEIELKRAGWLDSEHQLAPMLSVADLIYVCEILPPIYCLHYIAQREAVQHRLEITADEMDFLGVFLETLFNFVHPGDPEDRMVFTGMSGVLDRFYMSRDAGVALPKPAPKVAPYFCQLIDKICERGREGWTTLGLAVVGCANPQEQRVIVNGMERVKSSVRKKYRDGGHICSMQVLPPQSDRAAVIFYLFPDVLRPNRTNNMGQLAAEMFESTGRSTAVVVARCIDRWGEPYDVAAVFEDRPELR